jgi:hypothetical protein
MKKMIILTTLFVGFALQAQAQEHVGHRQRPQQQQQQEARPNYERFVIHGKRAEALFNDMLQSGIRTTDLSSQCDAPVLVIRRGGDVCFDRGENFHRSRYKCYVTEYGNTVSTITDFIFDFTHNACGGSGIRPIRRR